MTRSLKLAMAFMGLLTLGGCSWFSTGGFHNNTPPISQQPTVTIANPGDGSTVAGTFTVRVIGTVPRGPVTVVITVSGLTKTINSATGSTTFDSTQLADGDHTITAVLTDGNGTTASDSISVTVDNTTAALAISITAPADGDTVSGMFDVTVTGRVSVQPVTVEFEMDSVGDSIPTASGTITLDSTQVADGDHTLTAKITDGVGRTAQSSIMVTVFNAPPPTIGINAPADGDTVMGRLDVVVQGTASPAPVNIDVTMGGMMRSVAAIFGTVTFDTTQLANGQHAITATITDGVGRTATTSINVTVDNPAAPTIFIDAPNDGQNVRGPMEVTVIGTATDPLTIDITFGGLTRRITVAIGSVSFDTTQVANGSHAVTATITDNVGQAATHSINVTVDN